MSSQPASVSPSPRLLRRGPRFGSATIARSSLRAMAVVYLVAMVAVPIVAVVTKGLEGGLAPLRSALATEGGIEAIRLTLIAAAITAVVNAIFGTLLAYVLVRFRFPGRAFLSGLIDLPFAIPTLVTGVMLVALYGPASPVGQWLADNGLQVAFAPLGVVLALLFITLPFVVRTVQPVLAELDPAEEEAALVLGASGWATFRKIVLPALRPAIAAGALLAFARSIGEFGSIVIVSGNLIGETLTAPVFISQLASQFRPQEAAAVSTLLFAISFLTILVTYRLVQHRSEL
jgi:sulfate/thiosulfate transport system permease protein